MSNDGSYKYLPDEINFIMFGIMCCCFGLALAYSSSSPRLICVLCLISYVDGLFSSVVYSL